MSSCGGSGATDPQASLSQVDRCGRGEDGPDFPPAGGSAKKLCTSVAGDTMTMMLVTHLTNSLSLSVRYRSSSSNEDNSRCSLVGRMTGGGQLANGNGGPVGGRSSGSQALAVCNTNSELSMASSSRGVWRDWGSSVSSVWLELGSSSNGRSIKLW